MKKRSLLEKKANAQRAYKAEQKSKEEYLDKKRKANRKTHIIKESLIKKAKSGGFVMKKQKVVHQH
jgi:hypothetical protein